MKIAKFEVRVTYVVELAADDDGRVGDGEALAWRLAQEFVEVFEQVNGDGLDDDQYRLLEVVEAV